MHRRRGHGRDAFTLIELVIVIVIMAILSTLAVVSLRGTMDRYLISQAAETVERFDARARRDASRMRQPIRAAIDRNRKRLTIDTPGPGNAKYHLLNRVEIGKVRLSRRVTVGNQFKIQFSREGASPTYAVELRRGEMSQWLLVLGTSGQIVPLRNEGEVDAILSL
ncbi:MAG: pilus assembly FimT family protein [Rubripirellula sp.]